MRTHTYMEGRDTCRQLGRSIETHACGQDALMHVTHHIPKIEAGAVCPQDLHGMGGFHELDAGCARNGTEVGLGSAGAMVLA